MMDLLGVHPTRLPSVNLARLDRVTPASTPTGSAAAPRSARDLLRDVFGYAEFRSHQREIIEHVVAGGNAFVLMPTGGGKSLCYQVPALHPAGHGDRRLAAHLADEGPGRRVAGERRRGRRTSTRRFEPTRRAACCAPCTPGDLDLLYVAPERADDARAAESWTTRCDSGHRVALFAIDEAHCVSQWGHDFRPEYVQLGGCAAASPACPSSRCTATADEQTREDVRAAARARGCAVFVAGFDRPNIRYTVVEKREPLHQSAAVPRRSHRATRASSTRLSRKRVEEVAATARRRACRRGAVPRGPAARHERQPRPGRVPPRRGPRRRGHRRVRHGHRQARRALRRPLRHAQDGRELLSGDRPQPAATVCPRRPAAFGLHAVVVRMLIEGGGRIQNGARASGPSACASNSTS